MAFVHLKKLLLLALFTSGILSNSAMASYVSDGSSGEFHPLSDATLDLSDPARIPQFSNIYIDAGIRVTVRTPGTGYGYLLSADSVYLNGIFDAGSGSVSLNALNSIVMGSGAQLIGGNLVLSANNLTLDGTIRIAGGSALPVLIPDRLKPIYWQSFNLDGSGNVIISSRGDVSLLAPVPLPAASILLGSGLLGLLSFGAGRRRR